MTTYKTWIYNGRGTRRNLYDGRSQAKAYAVQNVARDTLLSVGASGRVQVDGHSGILSGDHLRTIDVIQGEAVEAAPDKLFKLALDQGGDDAEIEKAWRKWETRRV
jgi:hypothetical protein